jgi:leader peptidase (prepilin peptidase)/N-methyltransferase
MADFPSILLISLLSAAVCSSYRSSILPFPLTLGGSLAGMVCAVVFPQYLGENSSLSALEDSVCGFLAGLLAAWLLLELGKKLLGKITRHFNPTEPWNILQTDASLPPFICIGEEMHGWADVFARKSDCVYIDCTVLNVGGASYENVTAELRMETLTIRGAFAPQILRLENVINLDGFTSKVIIPREVMGFGVVFLSAMIGSFVGVIPALYIFGASLLLLCLVSFLRSITTRAQWSETMQIAPYSLIASVAYLALKHFGIMI